MAQWFPGYHYRNLIGVRMDVYESVRLLQEQNYGCICFGRLLEFGMCDKQGLYEAVRLVRKTQILRMDLGLLVSEYGIFLAKLVSSGGPRTSFIWFALQQKTQCL